jgi:HlyD family secretion protein
MKRPLLLVGIVLLVALGLWAKSALSPGPETVSTVLVERGTVEATITNSKAGTIEARRRAGLSTGTGGIVVVLEVERGDRVEAGQVLLTLDDARQRAELQHSERRRELAQATNRKACLAAERAHREWERFRQLAEDDFVSVDRIDALRTAFDLAEADCQVAAAEVALAGAAVDIARAELDKTVLRAPFDAIVGDVAVEIGEWVTPSVPLTAAPDLIDAIDPSSLYVSAPMDEVDANLLEVGQRARVTIDSFADRTFSGRVARIAPFVLDLEAQNRTVEVEVELDDETVSRRLLPGTSADVEIVLEVHEDVLRIPSFALLSGNRVLTVADEHLAARAVEPGIRNWDWVEVLTGLEAGERVVTSLDRPDLEDGQRVLVSDGNGP